MDDLTYTPDYAIVEGEVVPGKGYVEGEFNRVIIIPEREAYRVKEFMGAIDQREKTIVFCATQDHALMVRDLINQNNTSTDPLYCVRVTAADGALGDQHLKAFQDNEKTIINAESSDLFDVLAYVAFATQPLTREARAMAAKAASAAELTDKQSAFIDFVLAQYVRQGVSELDGEKLSPLLKLKYHNALADAFAELGKPEQVRSLFVGFQSIFTAASAAPMKGGSFEGNSTPVRASVVPEFLNRLALI